MRLGLSCSSTPSVVMLRSLIAAKLCSTLEVVFKSKPEKSELAMMAVSPCSKDRPLVSSLLGNSSLQDLISPLWCPHLSCVWYVVPTKSLAVSDCLKVAMSRPELVYRGDNYYCSVWLRPVYVPGIERRFNMLIDIQNVYQCRHSGYLLGHFCVPRMYVLTQPA